MLFLVKQVHTPDRCPKDVGGTKTLYDAAAAGVRLDRVFGDFSRHTIYYLLEADFVEDVQKFLAPGWLSWTSPPSWISSHLRRPSHKSLYLTRGVRRSGATLVV